MEKTKKRTWRGVAVLVRDQDVLCTPPVRTGGKEDAFTMAIFRSEKEARKWCGSDEHGMRVYKTMRVVITER